MKKIVLLLVAVIATVSVLAGCTANGEIKKTYNTAKEKLVNGAYDAALADFKAVESMLAAKDNAKGFEQLDAFIYACNYYRLSQYLKWFPSSVEYKIDEKFSVFGRDSGDDGLLLNYEGVSYTGGYYNSAINGMEPLAATFKNFMIIIPVPDKSNPTIPETIEWIYGSSDVLNGFAEKAKASGTLNPKDWFIIKKWSERLTTTEAIIEISEAEGDEEELEKGPKNGCVALMVYLNDFLKETQLDLTVADLGIRDERAALNEFLKNN